MFHTIKYFLLLEKYVVVKFCSVKHADCIVDGAIKVSPKLQVLFLAFVLLILVSLNVFGQNNREVEGKLCSAFVLTGKD